MNGALGRLLHSILYSVTGQPVDRHRRFFDQADAWTRDRIEAYQLQRLQELLHHAGDSVPFYRERFERIGLDPHDVRGFDDFARIPPLTRADVASAGRALISSRPGGRVHARRTSGSSGAPITLYKSNRDLAVMDGMMWHLYGWYGIRMGDPQARIWGTRLDSLDGLKVRVKDVVLNRARLSAFRIDRALGVSYFRKLARFRPAYVYCYPNATAKFVEIAVEEGVDLRALPLKAVICTGEMILPQVRAAIEAAFGMKVTAEYGSTECGVLGFECARGSLHVPAATAYVEAVPAPSLPGGPKRLLVTDLHTRAFPLIRYEVGDLGEIGAGPCECGRALPILTDLRGREGALVVRADGGLVDEGVFTSIFHRGAKAFRVVQKSPTEFDVSLVRAADFNEASEAEYLQRMRRSFGDGVRVNWVYVDEIPPEPSGKLRSFVSEVPRNRDESAAR